jgi:glycerophosphoryl diester phosphodiesterase
VRWIYALPAWLEGERPLRRALRASWRATAGRFGFLLRVLAAGLGIWFSVAFLTEAVLFTAAKLWIVGYADSLEGTLHILSAYVFASTVFRGVLAFLGMGWGACLWLVCYNHDFREADADAGSLDAARPAQAPAPVPRPRRLRWAIYAAAFLVIGSLTSSAWILRREFPQQRPRIIAHRAGAADAPENSLSALRKVLKDGCADMVEIDVTLTLDNEVVAAHDKDLMKQAKDPRIIRKTNYADLLGADIGGMLYPDYEGERLARLDDFLAEAKGHLSLILEFKHGKDTDLVERTIEAVRARGMEEDVILMSLELSEVRKVQRLAPDLRAGYFATVEVGNLTALDVYAIGVNDRLVRPKLVRAAHDKGVLLFAWTVDDPFRMAELAEYGVDGIITDDPVRAARVLDRVYALSPGMRLLLRFQRFWGVFDDKGWL